MSIQSTALFFIATICFFTACNDPSVVGLDLVEEDQINIQFRDDVPFSLTTASGMPIKTYAALENAITTYLCGELNDPVYGKNSASLYAELGLDLILPNFRSPDLEVDSIILVLPYDADAFFGDTTDFVKVEVYEIVEKMNNTQDYFSDQTLMIDPNPVGTFEFLPRPNTNIEFLDYRTGSEDTLQSSYLRIPLSNELGQRFLDQDTLIYQSDTTFVEYFHGLHIRTVDTKNTMMAFELNGVNTTDDGIKSGVYIYYDTLNTGGIIDEYFFPFTPLTGFTPVKFVHFEHDYTDTPIAENIGDKPVNEEVIYLQGMAGVNGKLEFPDLSDLENVVVNQAKLELTLIDESPNSNFPAAEQLLFFQEGDNGELQHISDFQVAAAAALDNLTLAYGGDLKPTKQDSTVQSYTVFMSNHFQNMIDGEVDKTVYIQISPPARSVFSLFESPTSTKANRANRSIVGSQNHSVEQFRAKFTLTYTKF